MDESGVGKDQSSAGWGDLGSTTSPRSWIALAALFLVIVTAAVWGLVVKIPVQTELEATITPPGLVLQIPAGHSGSVNIDFVKLFGEEYGPLGGRRNFRAGQTLMTLTPFGGGAKIPIVVPRDMTLALQVVDGMPVDPTTVVARGYPVNAPGESNLIIGYFSLSEIETLKSAESLAVATSDPSLSIGSLPIMVLHYGAVPVPEAQIARVIGNPLTAKQAFEAASGAPYAVYFAPTEPNKSLAGSTSAAATITVTTDSPHPLSLLFSN